MHCIKFCFLFILSNRCEKIKTFVLFLAVILKKQHLLGGQRTHKLHKKIRIFTCNKVTLCGKINHRLSFTETAVASAGKGWVFVSQTTKRALEASLKKLLLEKPLNKITINDITEDCGVNRMTFYYHFKDIYDLVDWILVEDAAKAMEGRRGFGTWSETYLDILHQLQDNKTLVLNVYRSVGREQVEQYLYRLLDPILKDFADRECHDITVQDADKQFVVDFYKYALVGMSLEWIRRDMKTDPNKMVERVSTMIHGDLRRALCRLSTGSLKIEE